MAHTKTETVTADIGAQRRERESYVVIGITRVIEEVRWWAL